MKKRLLKRVSYLLFISLIFTACVDEMDMVENERDLKQSKEQLRASGNWVKYLINYENSTKDKNAIFKVETLLKNIYDFIPEMREVIDDLIFSGSKFCISVNYTIGSNLESWYNPSYPPEIGFNGNGNITIERLLHELLHLYTFDTFVLSGYGPTPVCEEYEIRVLTDLLMRRYFKSNITYQGMDLMNDSYYSYLVWLDEVISNDSYNTYEFIKKFKEYGKHCMKPFEDGIINVKDIENYRPLLMKVIWFNNRN